MVCRYTVFHTIPYSLPSELTALGDDAGQTSLSMYTTDMNIWCFLITSSRNDVRLLCSWMRKWRGTWEIDHYRGINATKYYIFFEVLNQIFVHSFEGNKSVFFATHFHLHEQSCTIPHDTRLNVIDSWVDNVRICHVFVMHIYPDLVAQQITIKTIEWHSICHNWRECCMTKFQGKRYPSGAKWKQLTIRFALFGVKNSFFRAWQASKVSAILMIRCFVWFLRECTCLLPHSKQQNWFYFFHCCSLDRIHIFKFYARNFLALRQLHIFPIIPFSVMKEIYICSRLADPSIHHRRVECGWQIP